MTGDSLFDARRSRLLRRVWTCCRSRVHRAISVRRQLAQHRQPAVQRRRR